MSKRLRSIWRDWRGFVLFIAVYQLNPDYIMVLFTDPMGKKMLAVAVSVISAS